MKLKTLAAVLFIVFILVPCAPASSPTPYSVTSDIIQNPQSSNQQLKVGIDPGHGWWDSKTGAIGNGLVEKDINLYIVLLKKQILEDNGIEVVMTRNGDSHDKKLNQAALIMNEASPELVVSIHTQWRKYCIRNRGMLHGGEKYRRAKQTGCTASNRINLYYDFSKNSWDLS